MNIFPFIVSPRDNILNLCFFPRFLRFAVVDLLLSFFFFLFPSIFKFRFALCKVVCSACFIFHDTIKANIVLSIVYTVTLLSY